MILPIDFAKAFLVRLGLPLTENNVRSAVGWVGLEGGHYHNGAWFNPFNTTQPMPGAEYFMGGTAPHGQPSIKRYLDWEQGLEATVKTITNPAYPSYKNILNAFARSADPEETLMIINNDPAWGTHDFTAGHSKSLIANTMLWKDPHPETGGTLQTSDLKRVAMKAIGTLMVLAGITAIGWQLKNRI